jgi:hypothetical protein
MQWTTGPPGHQASGEGQPTFSGFLGGYEAIHMIRKGQASVSSTKVGAAMPLHAIIVSMFEFQI